MDSFKSSLHVGHPAEVSMSKTLNANQLTGNEKAAPGINTESDYCRFVVGSGKRSPIYHRSAASWFTRNHL